MVLIFTRKSTATLRHAKTTDQRIVRTKSTLKARLYRKTTFDETDQ